ncbi:hypothetical protein, partial [Pulveribacter sp.]|uniref:hypothetical protein n=1 Tax=Pulveribacter sp. TaxID=2678893 RepID=UPI00289EB11A
SRSALRCGQGTTQADWRSQIRGVRGPRACRLQSSAPMGMHWIYSLFGLQRAPNKRWQLFI